MHGYFETKEVMTYDLGGTDVFLLLKLYTLLSTSSISMQYFTKLKVFTSTFITKLYIEKEETFIFLVA